VGPEKFKKRAGKLEARRLMKDRIGGRRYLAIRWSLSVDKNRKTQLGEDVQRK